MKNAFEDSPRLTLDWNTFVENVEAMAGHLDRGRIAWRPHVKSHCSGPLARFLVSRGAVGVTVATLAQASAMISGGISSVLLTTPMGRPQDWATISELQEQSELVTAIDSSDHLELIERAAVSSPIPVVVELDLGLGRTGVRGVDTALALAKDASRSNRAKFVGFMGYEGKVFRTWPQTDKQREFEAAMNQLAELVQAAETAGIEVPLVTGGGTGSLFMDPAQSPMTESQAGGGVFMDQTYLDDFHVDRLRPALFVDTTVIAVHGPNRVVVDAGFKTFGVSRRVPTAYGRELVVDSLSAHMSTMSGDTGGLQVGSSVRLLPGYSDATTQAFTHIVTDGPDSPIPLWGNGDLDVVDH